MGDLSKFLQRQIAAVQAKEKKDEGYKRKLNWNLEKRNIDREKQQKEEEEKIRKGVSSASPSTNIIREKQQKEEIEQITENEKKDKGHKRKLNWNEKKKEKINREKERKEEEEQIIKGVNSAIPSTNIGFKMLQQMGYNPGLALGKHGQGMLEPVGIEIRRSRTGLGREDVEKEKEISKANEMESITQEKRMEVHDMMSEYEKRQKQLWHSRKIIVKYKEASAALAHLEEANPRPDRDDKEKIQEKKKKKKKDKKKKNEKKKKKVKILDEDVDETEEDEEEEEEEVTAEDLQEVLNRLRVVFNYCFYCGCRYESADAMLSNCPGVEEDDH